MLLPDYLATEQKLSRLCSTAACAPPPPTAATAASKEISVTHQTATKKHEKMVDYLEFDSSFYTNHTRYYYNVEFVRG